MEGKEHLSSLKVLDRELDNFSAALDYGLSGEQVELGIKLIFGLCLYLETRGYYSDGRHYLERALALPVVSGIRRGKAYFWAGLYASRLQDLHSSRTYYKECMALSKDYPDKELLYFAFFGQGLMHLDRGNYAEARSYNVKSVSLGKELNPFATALAQGNLGICFLELGEYEEARRLFDEQIATSRELGNQWMLTTGLIFRARLALALENYGEAHRYVQEALSISQEIGFLYGKLISLTLLGMAQLNQEIFHEARKSLEESLVMGQAGPLRNQVSYVLVGVVALLSKAWLKKRQANFLKQIACLGGAIEVLLTSMEIILFQPFPKYYELALEVAQSSLDAAAYKEAFARGQAMSQEEAIGYARQTLAAI